MPLLTKPLARPAEWGPTVPAAFLPARLALLILTAMRPRQWTKNVFVLAPLLFTGKAGDPHLLLRALVACACFCGLSGATYLINDLCDRRRDAVHPLKRLRPVALAKNVSA